jgi:hypothetical protein
MINKGLYTLNSGELPVWANNIARWLAYNKVIDDQFQKASKKIEEYQQLSQWKKLFKPQPGYPTMSMCDNPFPQPTAADLAKFEYEYPDMIKEWS